jgi:DNA polymerase (family 10)
MSRVPVTNADVADALLRMGDLLEIQGGNTFRVRAYRNAARTITDLPESVVAMLGRGEDLSDLPGIGKDLAGKIGEIVETGHLVALDRLARKLPGELAEMMRLPGLGPKRVSLLHARLGVSTLAGLEAAARAGKIRALHGFGEKTEQRILQALGRGVTTTRRTRLAVAEQVAEPLEARLRAVAGVRECVVAGSFRRRSETVGDLDLLVTATKPAQVLKRFTEYEEVREVLARGPTRSTVVLRSGMQVDLRVVPQACYGAALVYFTGSKAHNIALRKLAVGKKLKINEYGVFRGKRRIAGRTEREVYAQVSLPWVEPELREDRGEIEAARGRRLPRLVGRGDIRGDLHVHTDATDGHDSLAAMVEAARERGYDYVAIADHTKRLTMVHGQDAKRLAAQMARIERLNAKLRGFTVLKSAEVEILEDGRLDLPDSILSELDLTVCAIHYKLGLGERKQTERLLRAMDNPWFNILAHPTGRLIGEREPCALDMERLMRGALERGCYLEVNAQPDRLDLSDLHCRMAKELKLKLAISTDAHRTTDLDKLRFGLDQARRGWLEPDDVLNTRSWRELRRLLRRG